MRGRHLLAALLTVALALPLFAVSEGGGEAHGPHWFWKLLNTVLFFGVLWWALRKPVAKALAERAEAIRRAAEEARARRQKSEQIATEIEARLAKIDEEIAAIHQRAQQDGERQRRELIAAAEMEAAKILQAARNEIDNRLKHARQELTEYAGQLAADRARAILEQRITDDDRVRLFRKGLREVEEVQS
ncbi:MAG TPA: ATP synthase F0 subunit B [Thermoanaerobaculia bacterium]|nr:ATP synthase F0 subunit B [Thermoanaerobaculia bacterium]